MNAITENAHAEAAKMRLRAGRAEEVYKKIRSMDPELEDTEVIENALMMYAEALHKDAETIETAIENGSEDGNLENHEEVWIMRGCIELMHKLCGSFKRYMEYMDFVPESDEDEFTVSVSYLEIVQMLFLLHTNHSGGTSTAAKCRALGVKWGDAVKFTTKDDYWP